MADDKQSKFQKISDDLAANFLPADYQVRRSISASPTIPTPN